MRERREGRFLPTGDDHFYPLDNSAVFMAAIAGPSGPFVFRLTCELAETVRLPELQFALESLAPRFPFLFVSIRSGVFWHYLDPVKKGVKVEAEANHPARSIPRRANRPLVRVMAYRRRIACEFHHAVTDGTGAVIFLRAFVVEYLIRRGVGSDLPTDAFFGIPRPGEPVDPSEEEDAYARFFKPAAPIPEKQPKAFLLPGRRLRVGYRETVGIIPLQAALRASKDRSASLTELLAAVHLAALQDIYEGLSTSERRRSKKVVSVQIPINLRKIYPSRTLRNFFLFASPSMDLRLGHWEFEEILRRVHHQLRLGVEGKELLRQIKRNVGGERNPFGRAVFLPIKEVVLRAINSVIGVNAYSGSISNLGPIELPQPFSDWVLRFAITPSRARATGANITLVSWKNSVYLTIGSLARSREFERFFFSRLARLGLNVFVESSHPWPHSRFKGAKS